MKRDGVHHSELPAPEEVLSRVSERLTRGRSPTDGFRNNPLEKRPFLEVAPSLLALGGRRAILDAVSFQEDQSMPTLRRYAAAAIMALGLATTIPALAAPVTCGNGALGNRQFTVDPALAGGFCYAQNGNFTNENTFFAGLIAGLVIVDKDTTDDFPGGDLVPEGALRFTRTSDTAGTWTFLQSLWQTWDRLFLAAHYGGGGNTAADNPDSFIIELSPFDFTGTYALTGTGIQLNGLSNIYLLGIRCEAPGCNDYDVPEPGTLLLIGVGALGLALRRRLVS